MKIKSKDNIILFDKGNWKIVFAGIALIIIGFLLMMGGKTTDPNVFNPDELYSFRRVTLAPIIILLGFILQIFAILKKPSDNLDASENNIRDTKKEHEPSYVKDTNSKKAVVNTSSSSKIVSNKKKKKKKKKS